MYQFSDMGSGPGSGVAAFSLDRPSLSSTRPAFGHKVETMRSRAGDLDLVVDLGQRIGSPEWFRGLLTCTALCYAAFSFFPGMEPIAGATPAPFTDAQFEEARALSIAPLAYGSDTGRRMAPTDAVEPLPDTPERPIIDLRATFGRGDGFARVLERAGVGSAEADRVATLVGEAVSVTDVKAGTLIDLTLGRRPNRLVARPLDKMSFRARFDLRIELARVDGELRLTRIPISVDETPLRIQGRVGDSVYRSARAAGVPARVVESYI
ncbi:MAG: M23 family peptidase, partial [Allosphingosinicella sp.]